MVEFDKEFECVSLLWQHMIGYLIVIVASLLLELMISLTALRGSILDTEQRSSIPGLIYIRLGNTSHQYDLSNLYNLVFICIGFH